MTNSIPQSIDACLEQLTSDEPKLRYEAVHRLALIQLGSRFYEVYDAVWKTTKDPHPRVRWAAGIAASMMSARHSPGGILNREDIPYEINSLADNTQKDDLGIPDFISDWKED